MKALRQTAAFHRYFKSANHRCSGRGSAAASRHTHPLEKGDPKKKRGAQLNERMRRTNTHIRQGGEMDRAN
eukprot:5669158-Prymnesium_polylepis.1